MATICTAFMLILRGRGKSNHYIFDIYMYWIVRLYTVVIHCQIIFIMCCRWWTETNKSVRPMDDWYQFVYFEH